jgi:uncharacterized protein with ATP-grasp and redox domains
MGDDLDKFLFNLAYQDARMKIELEDIFQSRRFDHQMKEAVPAFLQLVASALSVPLSVGGSLWQRMNDNDLDALVFSVLEGCDPERQLKLLSNGCMANQIALDGLPSSRELKPWSLSQLIEYQVFAGTVWWSESGGSWITNFTKQRQFAVDDRADFHREVGRGARKLLFLSDDNGELVWDLLLVRRLLEANPKLQIAFVTNSIPVANNSNELTLRYCLNHPELSPLRDQKRFRILAEENPRSSLEPLLMSKALQAELASVDVAFLKGVGLFETAQDLPKPAYFAFVVHSKDSEIICGLKKGAGVFVRLPAKSVAYTFRKRTLLDFLRDLKA